MLRRLAAGERIGTQLLASTEVLTARKQWLADHLQVRGKVRIDDGARRALVAEGKSLLPIGVMEVLGNFDRGDVIACVDVTGREVARGLTNYGAEQARRIARRASSDIETVLGFVEERELTLILALDLSASLRFASAARSMKEAAAELSAIIAFTCLADMRSCSAS